MEIKKAEINDLPVVIEMKMAMFGEIGISDILRDDAEEMIYEKYSELYRENTGCHFLAYENGKAVACGGALIKGEVPVCFNKTPFYGYIVDVYCVPEERRNGHCSQIMKELIEWLRDKGVHNIKLKPSGAGRHLYEKLGFRDSGEMELWI